MKLASILVFLVCLEARTKIERPGTCDFSFDSNDLIFRCEVLAHEEGDYFQIEYHKAATTINASDCPVNDWCKTPWKQFDKDESEISVLFVNKDHMVLAESYRKTIPKCDFIIRNQTIAFSCTSIPTEGDSFELIYESELVFRVDSSCSLVEDCHAPWGERLSIHTAVRAVDSNGLVLAKSNSTYFARAPTPSLNLDGEIARRNMSETAGISQQQKPSIAGDFVEVLNKYEFQIVLGDSATPTIKILFPYAHEQSDRFALIYNNTLLNLINADLCEYDQSWCILPWRGGSDENLVQTYLVSGNNEISAVGRYVFPACAISLPSPSPSNASPGGGGGAKTKIEIRCAGEMSDGDFYEVRLGDGPIAKINYESCGEEDYCPVEIIGSYTANSGLSVHLYDSTNTLVARSKFENNFLHKKVLSEIQKSIFVRTGESPPPPPVSLPAEKQEREGVEAGKCGPGNDTESLAEAVRHGFNAQICKHKTFPYGSVLRTVSNPNHESDVSLVSSLPFGGPYHVLKTPPGRELEYCHDVLHSIWPECRNMTRPLPQTVEIHKISCAFIDWNWVHWAVGGTVFDERREFNSQLYSRYARTHYTPGDCAANLEGTGNTGTFEKLEVRRYNKLINAIHAAYPTAVGHFINEVFPRIIWMAQMVPDADILIVLSDRVKELLEMANIDPGRFVVWYGDPGVVFFANEVYHYSELPTVLNQSPNIGGTSSFHPRPLMRLMRDTLLRWKFETTPPAIANIEKGRVLLVWINRKNAATRRLSNHDEMMAGVAERFPQFSYLDFDAKGTVSDHVQIFQRANIIIGPHGAGLTHVSLCRQGTVVIEIGYFCRRAYGCYYDSGFAVAGAAGELDYYTVLASLDAGTGKGNRAQSMTVNVTDITTILDALHPPNSK